MPYLHLLYIMNAAMFGASAYINFVLRCHLYKCATFFVSLGWGWVILDSFEYAMPNVEMKIFI